MLQTIINYIVTAALSFLVGWVSKLYHQYLQDKQAEQGAENSVEPLKKADPNDGKAIDKSSDSALGGF